MIGLFLVQNQAFWPDNFGEILAAAGTLGAFLLSTATLIYRTGRMKAKQEADTANLNAKHDRDMEALKVKQAEDIKELKEELTHEIQRLERERDQKLQLVKDESDRRFKDQGERIGEANSQCTRHDERTKNLDIKLQQHEYEKETNTRDLSQLRGEMHALRLQYDGHIQDMSAKELRFERRMSRVEERTRIPMEE